MTVPRSRAEEVGFIVREGLKEAEVGRSTQNKELDVVAFEAKTEVLLKREKGGPVSSITSQPRPHV